jgi:hypothetical protein
MQAAWQHVSSCAGAAACWLQEGSSRHRQQQQHQQQRELQQKEIADVRQAECAVRSSGSSTGKASGFSVLGCISIQLHAMNWVRAHSAGTRAC